MNGTSRLYRSTSEAMLGGVAAGLGNYFKIDPTIIRALFVILAFVSAGGFAIVYLAMWLLIPTAGSTATQPGQVVQENINSMGDRFRSLVGSQPGPGATTGTPTGTSTGTPTTQINGQSAPAGTTHKTDLGPIILIGLGVLFLLGNFGIRLYWGLWWPILLIGLGVLLLNRRTRP